MDSPVDCVDVNEIMAMFGDWTLRLDIQVCCQQGTVQIAMPALMR